MSWLSNLENWFTQTPQANKVFTNKVSPQLQAQAQASYQSPVGQALQGAVQDQVNNLQMLQQQQADNQQSRDLANQQYTQNKAYENTFGPIYPINQGINNFANLFNPSTDLSGLDNGAQGVPY
ncbi:MAG: hypothetical protein ACYDBV_14980 [Nitrospiria bacterium]